MSLNARRYGGPEVEVRFDGVDISGDGRAVIFHDTGAKLEAIDLSGEWADVWQPLEMGVESSLTVTHRAIEVEHIEAVLDHRAISEPSLDVVTASLQFRQRRSGGEVGPPADRVRSLLGVSHRRPPISDLDRATRRALDDWAAAGQPRR
jgi:hypothetical protein